MAEPKRAIDWILGLTSAIVIFLLYALAGKVESITVAINKNQIAVAVTEAKIQEYKAAIDLMRQENTKQHDSIIRHLGTLSFALPNYTERKALMARGDNDN